MWQLGMHNYILELKPPSKSLFASDVDQFERTLLNLASLLADRVRSFLPDQVVCRPMICAVAGSNSPYNRSAISSRKDKMRQ